MTKDGILSHLKNGTKFTRSINNNNQVLNVHNLDMFKYW